MNSMKKLNRVVDVGANVGSYSSDILSLNPKASITCFEPDPRAFKSLSEKLGHSSDVHLINKGVSDQKGTLRLNMAPRTTHSSFVGYGESIDAVSVEVTTLDDTKLTGHIDLIKIDVEGFEYKVLQGAKETLKRTSFVQFEFSGANHQSRLFVKDFIDYLNGYGFDLYKIKADRLTRISGNPEERFALKNYLAIHRSMKTDAEIKI
jgi:FkbM family methyltransferase